MQTGEVDSWLRLPCVATCLKYSPSCHIPAKELSLFLYNESVYTVKVVGMTDISLQSFVLLTSELDAA